MNNKDEIILPPNLARRMTKESKPQCITAFQDAHKSAERIPVHITGQYMVAKSVFHWLGKSFNISWVEFQGVLQGNVYRWVGDQVKTDAIGQCFLYAKRFLNQDSACIRLGGRGCGLIFTPQCSVGGDAHMRSSSTLLTDCAPVNR